jgi:cytochrome oxidase Cu insertion factor (SCO1/SenC/PrrC family)
MTARTSLMVAAFAFGIAGAASAQTPPAQELPKPLEIGAVAPDFELPGATRYGVLRDPVKLSDFKGKTVVLAFFFRARTRG